MKVHSLKEQLTNNKGSLDAFVFNLEKNNQELGKDHKHPQLPFNCGLLVSYFNMTAQPS